MKFNPNGFERMPAADRARVDELAAQLGLDEPNTYKPLDTFEVQRRVIESKRAEIRDLRAQISRLKEEHEVRRRAYEDWRYMYEREKLKKMPFWRWALARFR